jgi:hypothetical protein
LNDCIYITGKFFQIQVTMRINEIHDPANF